MKKIVLSITLAVALFAGEQIPPSAGKVTRLDAIKVVGYSEKSGKKRYTDLTPESTVAKFGAGIQVLELVSSVEFKTDSTIIEQRFKILLDDWVRFLIKRPNIEVLLVGRADMRGPVDYNLRLSKRRAETVKKYFIRSGIDKKNILILASGEEDQLANNSTPAGKEINRSVEIRFIDKSRADEMGTEQIMEALFEPSIDSVAK